MGAYEGNETVARVRREDDGPVRDLLPIAAGMEELEQAVAKLQEVTERLEHRLGPILGPDRPHPTDGGARAVDRVEQSSLAEWLDVMATRTRAAVWQAERILTRIELG